MSDRWEQPKSKLRQAAQQALDSLELVTNRFLDATGSYGDYENEALESAYAAIIALRAALEPVTDSHDITEALRLAQACEAASPIPGGLYSEAAQMLRKQCAEIERMKGVCE